MSKYSHPFREASTTNSLTQAVSVIKTGHGKQAAKVPRASPDRWVHLLGQLASAAACAFYGLEAAGAYT